MITGCFGRLGIPFSLNVGHDERYRFINLPPHQKNSEKMSPPSPKRTLSDTEEDVGKKDGESNLKPIDFDRFVGTCLSTTFDRFVGTCLSTTNREVDITVTLSKGVSIFRVHSPQITDAEQSHPQATVTPTTKYARIESAHVQPSTNHVPYNDGMRTNNSATERTQSFGPNKKDNHGDSGFHQTTDAEQGHPQSLIPKDVQRELSSGSTTHGRKKTSMIPPGVNRTLPIDDDSVSSGSTTHGRQKTSMIPTDLKRKLSIDDVSKSINLPGRNDSSPQNTDTKQRHSSIVTPVTKHARTESARVQPSKTSTHATKQIQRSVHDEDHSNMNHDTTTKNVIHVTKESICNLIIAAIDATTETGVVEIGLSICKNDNSFISFYVCADSVVLTNIFDCQKHYNHGTAASLPADKSTSFLFQIFDFLMHVESVSPDAAAVETPECTISTVSGKNGWFGFDCEYHKPTRTVKFTETNNSGNEITMGTIVIFHIPVRNLLQHSFILSL